MNTDSKEHLSSLMDGETNPETGRFLVRRLGSDSGLRDVWARYHLIRECLRHQEGQYAQQDLCGRVSQALTAEPPVRARFHLARGWLKPLAGAAVAASVAVVAVFAVTSGTGSAPARGIALPSVAVTSDAASVESFTSPNITGMTQQSQPVNLSGTPARENGRMNTYLLRHYQVAGDAGGRGFVSFVPIVVTQVSPAREPAGNEKQQDGEPDLR